MTILDLILGAKRKEETLTQANIASVYDVLAQTEKVRAVTENLKSVLPRLVVVRGD